MVTAEIQRQNDRRETMREGIDDIIGEDTSASSSSDATHSVVV